MGGGGAASSAAASSATDEGVSWQRFDDSFVRPVAADAPDATTKGYIFFYVSQGLVG